MTHEQSAVGMQPLEPEALIVTARARLAQELAWLPLWESALLRARLRLREGPQAVSLGALTHFIRHARRVGEYSVAQELFVTLLERIEYLNWRWVGNIIGRTFALRGAAGLAIRDDLAQELTLQLWEQIGLGEGEAWELFFQRSLAFTQRHTATAFMRRRGYWSFAGVAQPSRGLPVSLARLLRADDVNEEEGVGATLAPEMSSLDASELTDLKSLVQLLPTTQRVAVVLRFWCEASEAEIARALGGVTTRTVRNYLRRAYTSLQRWYVDGVDAADDTVTEVSG